jgi:hypothetical protein
MKEYPQVALFGSTGGNWREDYVIPLLKKLNVSYYHPAELDSTWTQVHGTREADIMLYAETIVMVINHSSPGFGGLAETGWAALGAAQRHQTFILYIPMRYKFTIEGWSMMMPQVRQLVDMIDDYAGRTRYLVLEHAKRFEAQVDDLYVVENIDGMLEVLKKKYEK